MNKKNVADFYPLSPMQQGMWFHSLAAPESGVYVEQMRCTLTGALHTAAFRRAWEHVIDRHPLLRTAIVGAGLKEPVQVVYRQVALPLAQHDWRACTADERENRLAAFLADERRRGFDLSRPPLLRLALLHTAVDRHIFVWTYHHLLLDGWSLPLLLQEVFAGYEAFRLGQTPALPPRRPFRDYITWLKQQDMNRATTFWRERLAGFTTPTPLVVDRPVTAATPHPQYHSVLSELPAAETAVLQTLARRHQLTLNSFVQGAWALLLSRYSGRQDVCFGATVSGRPPTLAGSEEMIGLFINTLPVRVRIPPQQPVIEWLQAVQAQQVALRQYEYSPLVEIQRCSDVPPGEPLFESLLVFENYPVETAVATPTGSLTLQEIHSVEQTNYPLTLVAGVAETLHLHMLYEDGRFTRAAVTRMMGHLRTLLGGIAADPARPLAALPLLTPAERRQILVDWNDTAAAYPTGRCVHELFAEQAAKRPHATALLFEDEKMSYAQLNGRANRLAHHLIKQGVGPEAIVAICLPRCPEMVIAALAVLKAGAAYLPLDPTYPAERIAFMLEDAQPTTVITNSTVNSQQLTVNGQQTAVTRSQFTIDDLPIVNRQSKIVNRQSKIVNLDTDWPIIAAESDENPAVETSPDHLAYVIYTSGSTGRPKGSLLHHRGLNNLCHAYIRQIELDESGRVLQFFSFGFDGSVADIFPTLLCGATLVLPRRETLLSTIDLHRCLQETAVTHILMTPSILALLPADNLPHLRIIIAGGEMLTQEVAARWLPGRKLINAYGPTETTVAATLYRAAATDDSPQTAVSVPIGRPIANVQLYVLDPNQRPVPVGVPGELHIGGAGVGRGYLHRPALTAERFIPNPVISKQYSVISEQSKLNTDYCSLNTVYCTGDLVRYLPDGNLEFLGRIDHQVKIRGFRVELGEIEAALRQDESVAAAVVTADGDGGEKRLIAYVVPCRDGAAYDEAALRRRLQATLPAYMVPALFIKLDALPLTPSGKVDRRALPAVDGARSDHHGRFIPPRDTLEVSVAQIWEEALNVRPVGVTDNFFELGGHSLLAVRLMARIQQQFGQAVTLTDLLQGGTVEHLAALLRRQTAGDDEVALIPLIAGDDAKRPLFFIHPSGGSVHWYATLASYLDGERPFIGIQARGLRGSAPLHTSIPEMAAAYVAAVQARQPAGPYLLGGWSLGVIIAYEMARRLEAQGETVALLALLDQGPRLPHDEPQDTAAYLVETFGKHVPLSLEALRALDEEAQIARVFTEAQRVDWILPDVTLPQFSHFVRLLRTHTDAWRRYRLRSYGGDATLFRAAVQEGETLSRDMGWAALAAGGVTVVDVPGDHLSMMHEPHAAALAQALQAQVDAAVQPPAAEEVAVIP